MRCKDNTKLKIKTRLYKMSLFYAYIYIYTIFWIVTPQRRIAPPAYAHHHAVL